MKIDDSARVSGAALNRTAEVKPRSAEQVGEPSVAEQRADAASVSELASSVLTAGEQRVEELKRLYEAGKYSVPASEIAAKLIGEHES